MSTPKDRVQALVERGALGKEEGERLLGALTETPAETPFVLRALGSALNPFERFGGGIAAAVGCALAVAGVALARFGVHYDGFLDLHVGHGNAIPVSRAVTEQVVAWIVPSLLLWGVTLFVRRGTRLVDILGATGLARTPLVAFAPLIVLTAPVLIDGKIPPFDGLTLISIGLSLAALSWHLVWLFFGLRNATGLRGGALGASFGCFVVLAEIVSKVVLFKLS